MEKLNLEMIFLFF